MNKNFRMLTMGYLIFSSSVLGMMLYAGIVVTSVTFNTHLYVDAQLLTQFQEGQIMTENFLRLSYVVNILIVFVVFYEGYKFKKFERDTLTQVLTFIILATALLFSQYYIPDIIAMQSVGEAMTQSEAFINTHKGSEINSKIFALSLLLLIVQNMRKACK
ncbi:membrane protein [hydrothermal vent metagenome]|uniref:Membrane protein n=1 Tax=hydrothermal vent metagenome TaxID=652676 RepID=A0A1W1CNT3_9ZZZZ